MTASKSRNIINGKTEQRDRLYRWDASKSRDACISNEAGNNMDTRDIRDDSRVVEKPATFSKGRQQ
jgi:hypothetical protein